MVGVFSSLFSFDKRSFRIDVIKQKRFEAFLKSFRKLNSKNEQEVRILLTKYLKTLYLSLKIYENTQNNLWETFKYLNELKIIKTDIGQDMFVSSFEIRFFENEKQFSLKSQSEVVKIKNVLRILLGANNNENLFENLIRINKEQIRYVEDLLHPDNKDFITLKEEELKLEGMFEIEKRNVKKINKQIRTLNSSFENLAILLNQNLINIENGFLNLKKEYQNNPAFTDKLMALSRYANSHASIIAFSIVSLSAALFIGPYLGIATETITIINKVFHSVATYGEGLQSIEEIPKIKNWIQNIGSKLLSEKELNVNLD